MIADFLREWGPPLARNYPGLPDLESMSPVDIAAYVMWLVDREESPGG